MVGFMMIKNIEFKFSTHSKVFNLPMVESKIDYLTTFFKNERRGNKKVLNVVIAVPYFDSKMRIIQNVDDGGIHRYQLKVAKEVAMSLKDSERINVVDVISDPRQSSKMIEKVDTNIDYVVFLAPFTSLERNYIGAELASNTQSGKVNRRLHAVEVLSRKYA